MVPDLCSSRGSKARLPVCLATGILISSVCLSVTLCIVANQYIIQQNCLNTSYVLGTSTKLHYTSSRIDKFMSIPLLSAKPTLSPHGYSTERALRATISTPTQIRLSNRLNCSHLMFVFLRPAGRLFHSVGPPATAKHRSPKFL